MEEKIVIRPEVTDPKQLISLWDFDKETFRFLDRETLECLDEETIQILIDDKIATGG